MKIADGELRQILLHDLKLSPDTVRELVADSRQSRHSLLRVALESGLTSDSEIAKAHAKRIGVPYIDLGLQTITKTAIQALPRQLAVRYQVICFDITATSVKIAMIDPRDERARKAIKDYCGKTVRRYLATKRDITKAIQNAYQMPATPLPLSAREILATLIEQASRNGSRDIHFEPANDNLVVRRRIGTKLQTMSTLPLATYRPLIALCKTKINADVSRADQPLHGSFLAPIRGITHSITVSILPTVTGEKMVLRLTLGSESIPSLREIGYSTKQVHELHQFLSHGRGLIIIGGGHGSDLQTTLARLAAQAVLLTGVSVSTIERPIHYRIAAATQVEATHAVPYGDIIGTVIAQNPTLVVTTELGTKDSAEQLIDFSLGHHMAISGLYATSLVSTLKRLISYPVAPALLAASLKLIVVQHQIDALCPYCRVSFTPAGPLKKVLWQQFNFSGETKLFRKGSGCNHCRSSHQQTRLVIEWLPITTELQQLIATGADETSIKQYISQASNLNEELGKLAARGHISIDEAAAQAN
jgi:type IV pilus assembly protein PilB